ncbi:hypothetical protein PC119_g18889 [Phytophthora cactorum]|nr:hypothetical protein PC119_g18889 [Phytophthora cactorum]KAG3066979.1 hypothetical protein PC122_g17543 [Phytophthora cactorum]
MTSTEKAHGGPGVCPSLFSLAVESAAVSSAVQSDYQSCLTVCWAWCSEYLGFGLKPSNSRSQRTMCDESFSLSVFGAMEISRDGVLVIGGRFP